MTRRVVAALLLAAVAAGCVQWAAVDLDGPALAPGSVPSNVRLLRASGDTVLLTDAALRGDSITGFRASGVPATVALSELQGLEVRRATPAMVLAPAIIIGLLVVPRTFSHWARGSSGSSIPPNGS